MGSEVKGLKELEAKLAKLSQGHGKGAMRNALRKVAKPIAKAAEAAAPVASGGLKKSIKVSTRLNKSQATQQKREEGKHAVDLFIGATSRHGGLVEFGTEKTAPQPFLAPAWDGGKDQLFADLKTEMWKNTLSALKKNGIETDEGDEE